MLGRDTGPLNPKRTPLRAVECHHLNSTRSIKSEWKVKMTCCGSNVESEQLSCPHVPINSAVSGDNAIKQDTSGRIMTF